MWKHRTRRPNGRRLSLFGPGYSNAGNFSPIQLPGLALWLDVSDPATLYQDSALTTLAAADADPLGGWKDKSGLGRHVLQATSSKRFTYKAAGPYALLDGVDDNLSKASLALSGVGITISACVTLDAAGSFPTVAAYGDAVIELRCSVATKKPECIRNGGTATSATVLTLGTPYVLTGRAAFAINGSIDLRINGATSASAATGVATTSPQAFTVGGRSTGADAWGGKIYGLVVTDGILSDADALQLERYLGRLGGVSF